MSAWWLLPLALAACLAVVAVAACLSPKRYEGRHLAVVPDWEPLTGEQRAALYGSMILGEERAIQMPRAGRAFGAGPMWKYARPDWREQTAADLAPEALDSDVQPGPYLDAIAAGHGSEWEPADFPAAGESRSLGTGIAEGALQVAPAIPLREDSGPGDLSSLDPGPDPDWLDGQLAVLYEWVRGQYAAAAA